ncbi:MAG: antibiotic biosynthesis monooxygenase [Flavobacteriales bacterium]|nr:antibiotic biosynthesis monooxygenase [Flavobacteriales bacterium]
MKIVKTPPAPYYAVIFTALLGDNLDGYEETATRIMELAKGHDGFYGMEEIGDKWEINISYWRDVESMMEWRKHSEHVVAQETGKKQWYECYKMRIAKVERDYDFYK